ncbi:MAG: FAD/NAD(P)-binding protein [Ignavibacteriales bacterium]|nr:FAD/NAD(P)-binding protein [Ignavibacteriales bacterium]
MVPVPENLVLSEIPSMVPVPCRVMRTYQETGDTFTLELESLSQDGFSFRPGQFNMLYIHGVGEVPISISGDPHKPESVVHTVRVVGIVTWGIKKLRRRDFLGIRGPFGTPWPVDLAEGNDVVIVAGGIGLAPLRPAIYDILARREKFGKFVLLYGTRGPSDILYFRQLEDWRARFDFDLHVTVDRAFGPWKGNVGVVTTLIPKAHFDPVNTVALICGPEVMMRFTILELLKKGIPEDKIFISMERNMKCGIGLCGHCQFGPHIVCRDGPVFPYSAVRHLLGIREI